jgi:coiled-coil domain-containing protein 63/114
MIDKL